MRMTIRSGDPSAAVPRHGPAHVVLAAPIHTRHPCRGSCDASRRDALRRRLANALVIVALITARVAAATSADLSLALSVSDPAPMIGSNVTFTLRIANAGPDGVQRVIVRDRLPGGYSYLSHMATRGIYDPASGLWSGFGISAGGSIALTIVARVNDSGNRTEVAEIMRSVAADPDSTPGNGDTEEDDYAQVITTPHAPPSGQNLVVFMVDDLDSRSLQDLLDAGLMPNLATRIIARGVTFTSAYVTTPLCCPSRASFFKGQYPHNTGIVNNELMTPTGLEWAVTQFDDTLTLATRLRALGYTTAHVGKYLNGYGSDPTLGSLYPAFDPHYVPPGWSQWRATVDMSTYCVYDYTISIDGVPTPYYRPAGQRESSQMYQTNVLADLAEGFVAQHVSDATPFYLEAMPLAPHAETCDDAYGGPPPSQHSFKVRIRPAPEDDAAAVPAFTPGPAYDEDVADKPSWLTRRTPLSAEDAEDIVEQYQQRLRSLLSVDRLIGRVAEALGPEIDRTTLVFTSDNGWFYGDHRQTGKILPYREASLVPLYIATPESDRGVIRD
jgi:uncharacterized repeat protein (TIGR01451 family)